MGKPFQLRLKPLRATATVFINKRKNNTHLKLAREVINKKDLQMMAAVEWCKENKKRGWAALKTGNFPLISDTKSVNRRLDGVVMTTAEYESRSILTNKEEQTLVTYLKNMNRCNQGVKRSGCKDVILKILEVRKYALQKGTNGGKRFKKALKTKKISRAFWRRFDSKYPDLTQKRQGTVSMNRALNCSREIATAHLDDLARELIRLGIFTNSEQHGPGKWSGTVDLSRIYNFDETPQFINYGVDGTANGLVYAGRGDECKEMIRENRECVTICPFVSYGGQIEVCQVIFKEKGISSHMVNPKIPNLFVSTTEKGVQDKQSLEAAYHYLDKLITKKGIQKPVLLVSDGHSSRFSPQSINYLFSNQLEVFLGPPDTTGLTQLLDQVNQSLHSHYRATKRSIFSNEMTVDREGFMEVLGEIWTSWTTPETITKAAKLVGVSKDGLDIAWLNQEKMDKAEMLIAEESIAKTPSKSKGSVESDTPEGMRRGSNEYFKFKLQKSEERNEELRKQLSMEREMDLNEIPSFLEPKKIRPKKKKSKKITQVHGSLSGCDILKKLEELERDKEEKIRQQDEKAQALVDLRIKFEKCKDVCVCTGAECSMKLYKQCPVCLSVQKSACSKRACRNEDGSKQTMIRVNLPTSSKNRKTTQSRKRKNDWSDSESDDESDSSTINYWENYNRCSDNDDSSNAPGSPEIQLEYVDEIDKVDVDLEEREDSLSVDMVVIVEYEGELFPGRIVEVVEDGVKVSCMQKSTSIGSTWKWPQYPDENVYPLCDVKFTNVTLNKLPGTSRKTEFHVAELDNIWG